MDSAAVLAPAARDRPLRRTCRVLDEVFVGRHPQFDLYLHDPATDLHTFQHPPMDIICTSPRGATSRSSTGATKGWIFGQKQRQ